MSYRIIVAGAFAAVLSLAGCAGSTDAVLASFTGDTLRVSDYEEMYLRTRSTPPEDEQQKADFLNTLLDYRLKLHEARVHEVGKDKALRDELTAYRNQLAVNFLYERDLVEPAVRTLYERRFEQIQPQHLFVRIERDDYGAVDTMSAFIRARDLLLRAQKPGTSFDSLTLEFSDDASVKLNQGVLGWFIAGTTFPQMDDMLYNMELGEVAPQLLRSGTGYHILRLRGRTPARLRLRPAHILYRLDLQNPLDTAAAYAQLSLVLDSLKRGLASFEDLARRNSMDSLSGAQGGDLGWLNRGTNIEARFEEALFNLQVGEVSPVIRSTFGMHIIKVLDEEPPLPLDEQREDLRRIYRQERFVVDVLNYLKSKRAEYGFEVKENVLGRVLSRVPPGATTSTPDWERSLSPDILQAYMFQLNTGPATVRDVIGFSKTEPSLQMRPITWGLLDTLALSYADHLITIDLTQGFEQQFPDFARLVRENEESSLIARIEDEKVVSGIDPTEEEVRAFWEANRGLFMHPDRVGVQEIYTYDKVKSLQLLDSLAAGADFDDLAGRLTQRYGFDRKRGDWGLLPLGQNELSKAAAELQPGDYTGPVMFQSGFSIVRCTKREAAREMTFEEARPAAQTRLKSALRDLRIRDWAQTLREKYRAQLFPEHLKHAFASDGDGQ